MKTILLAAGAVATALVAGQALAAHHHARGGAAIAGPYAELNAYLKASPAQRARKDWWSQASIGGEASTGAAANTASTSSSTSTSTDTSTSATSSSATSHSTAPAPAATPPVNTHSTCDTTPSSPATTPGQPSSTPPK